MVYIILSVVWVRDSGVGVVWWSAVATPAVLTLLVRLIFIFTLTQVVFFVLEITQ